MAPKVSANARAALKAARVDFSSEAPLHGQIRASLQGMIANGAYPSGSTLPGEQELARHFKVSRITVKRALNDAELAQHLRLTSANSISLGRLLPQTSYYAKASLEHWRAHRQPLGFVVPTGNLGNALAASLGLCSVASAAALSTRLI